VRRPAPSLAPHHAPYYICTGRHRAA